MVGPFRRSKYGNTHLLVAVDKFTKWDEAEPVSKCDAATTLKFLKNISFRFGYPHSIITDNGSNLSEGVMEAFSIKEHIRLDLTSVAHPQSNGQAERANQELLHGIKPRLCVLLIRMSGCWVEELSSVLWSIRTTPNRSTGFTPFFLVYGSGAVLPSDIRHDSPRVTAYVEADNEEARQNSLDVLYEKWELAASK